MQEFTGVYWSEWHHCLVKKLITTKVQVGRKEIYNIAIIKNRVLAGKDRVICCDQIIKIKLINIH